MAATISSMQSLHLEYGVGRPDSTALQTICGLTSLSSLHVENTSFGLQELEALKFLPNLCQLRLSDDMDSLVDSGPDNIQSFCWAVGRLTNLTSLALNYVGCDKTPLC